MKNKQVNKSGQEDSSQKLGLILVDALDLLVPSSLHMDLGDSIGVTACRVSRSHVYWSDSTYIWALCILG